MTRELFKIPLSELEDEDLKKMAKNLAAGNAEYHLPEVIEELRYREQRRIADSLRKIVTVQVFIAGLAVVVALVVAVTNVWK